MRLDWSLENLIAESYEALVIWHFAKTFSLVKNLASCAVLSCARNAVVCLVDDKLKLAHTVLFGCNGASILGSTLMAEEMDMEKKTAVAVELVQSHSVGVNKASVSDSVEVTKGSVAGGVAVTKASVSDGVEVLDAIEAAVGVESPESNVDTAACNCAEGESVLMPDNLLCKRPLLLLA